MRQHAKKPEKSSKEPTQTNGEQSFTDLRSHTTRQLKLQESANNHTNNIKQLQQKANNYVAARTPVVQAKTNTTGLPDKLKSGIENLSGHSMDDVKVHYNSSKPAQLNAHAYAQGTNIHIASGQEKHLAHEAWHVVQQKQGRVKPTKQLKEKVAVNDEEHLEKEADVMGAKALQMKQTAATQTLKTSPGNTSVVQGKLLTKDGTYNSSANLPPTTKVNLNLTLATNNQQTYLVENNKAIQDIGSTKGGQLVGPYVHIIGEDHNASQWATIKKKWGYSGKITYEDLSDSSTVKSSETAHHLETDPTRKAENILENLHAKMITDLAVSLYGAKRLKSIYTNMKTYLQTKNDTEYGKMKTMGSSLRSEISSYLSDFDFYWKQDYVKAGATARKKAIPTRSHAENILVHLMDTYGDKITKDFDKIRSNPIGVLTFRTPTMIAELTTWLDYADQLIKNIELTIELLHALIEEETQPADKDGMNAALTEQRKRIKGIHANSNDQTVLNSASPLREHFMILRLRAMGAPSIAVVGHAHRDNLKKTKPIPQDKYYDDYNDFVTKTTSKA